MKRLLLVIGALLVSCVPPQDDPSQVIDLRVLGVQFEPPELMAGDCRALLASEALLDRFRPFVAFEYKYDTDPLLAANAFDMFARLGYRLEALAFDGQRFPFDWQQAPTGYKQVDVLCLHAA